jgi:hypothetical protein
MSPLLAHHLAATTAGLSVAGVDRRLLVVGILAIALGGYVFSLWAHPYTKCRACNGTRRHRGAIFFYASRTCRACRGSGRKLRFGARIFRD